MRCQRIITEMTWKIQTAQTAWIRRTVPRTVPGTAPRTIPRTAPRTVPRTAEETTATIKPQVCKEKGVVG